MSNRYVLVSSSALFNERVGKTLAGIPLLLTAVACGLAWLVAIASISLLEKNLGLLGYPVVILAVLLAFAFLWTAIKFAVMLRHPTSIAAYSLAIGYFFAPDLIYVVDEDLFYMRELTPFIIASVLIAAALFFPLKKLFSYPKALLVCQWLIGLTWAYLMSEPVIEYFQHVWPMLS